MSVLNIPDNFISNESDDEITYDFNLTIFTRDDSVRFAVGDITTSWMSIKDRFVRRIQFENLNSCFLQKHLLKEIEVKNALDKVAGLLEKEKYRKAIETLDDVLYYNPHYGEALLLKSKALFGQKHFVKSLRHYKKSVKVDNSLNDVEYHKLLLKKSSEERDAFPKIKRNIYAGDEYSAKGDFEKALKCYDNALADSTGFKEKILPKLLNKKGIALVRLKRIDEATDVFARSCEVCPTDCACYFLGLYSCGPNEYLKRSLKITKKQLLCKSKRLIEFGEFEMALDCLDEFLNNHYNVDGNYRMALNLKFDALKGLGKDTGEVESLLNAL